MTYSYFTVDRSGRLANHITFGNIVLLKEKTEVILPRHNIIEKLFPQGMSMHGLAYLTRFDMTAKNNFNLGLINDSLTELTLEIIRLNFFPKFTSRFQSIFAFKTYEEAAKFGKETIKEYTDNIGKIYELDCENEQPRFDIHWLKRQTRVAASLADSFSYWEQKSNPDKPPFWEYLISLPVHIKEAKSL